MCKILGDLDAYKLVIACCMQYVKENNKAIVTQTLGVISGTLAVSLKKNSLTRIPVKCMFK